MLTILDTHGVNIKMSNIKAQFTLTTHKKIIMEDIILNRPLAISLDPTSKHASQKAPHYPSKRKIEHKTYDIQVKN